MKNIFIALFLILISTLAQSKNNSHKPKFSCQNYRWSDVEQLVQPYLDDTLYTALVMQGQSSNYNVSAAATQAMDKSLPKEIKDILKAIIKANCE